MKIDGKSDPDDLITDFLIGNLPSDADRNYVEGYREGCTKAIELLNGLKQASLQFRSLIERMNDKLEKV